MSSNVVHLDSMIRWHCKLSLEALQRKQMIVAIHHVDKARSLYRLRKIKESNEHGRTTRV